MQKVNKSKLYLLLSLFAALALLLNSRIEGAAAWLQMGQKMSNEFFSPVVDIEIIKAEDGTNFTIRNQSNTTVFVRVEVIGTLMEGNTILSSVSAGAVTPTEGFAVAMNVGNEWQRGADGYYYYLTPLKVGDNTVSLLNPESTYSSAYELNVYAQAILPEDVVKSWDGASLDENFRLIPPEVEGST